MSWKEQPQRGAYLVRILRKLFDPDKKSQALNFGGMRLDGAAWQWAAWTDNICAWRLIYAPGKFHDNLMCKSIFNRFVRRIYCEKNTAYSPIQA